ncbi:MAG: BatA domain-containing protein [Fidelibacterota bacterium]|nr:MAG: BatA domain-containing protein [Candidatus Neomarinimicrobiota bacterium]
MSFLIPQALWALPAIALPLIIHLISQTNTRLVDFSTLHFLRKMEHESLRRLRWHQWLVIFIRTLLILVLVLLLARPVVKGYFRGWISENASTLSVVVIDDSFSMSGETSQMGTDASASATWRAGVALELLHEVLADQSSRGRAVILRLSDARTIYQGSLADMPGVDDIASLCKPGYHRDNLTAVLDTLSSSAFQNIARLYANRELYLISDFQAHQQGALRHFRSDTTIWNGWHFFLVPIPRQENNVAVTQAEVETAIPLVGELMDVAVTLLNTGRESRRKVPIQVVLNDVRSGQLVIDLNPGKPKTVRFKVAPNEPGHQLGYAEVDRDERPGDNRYHFHTYIPPQVRILLIEPPEVDPSFLRSALGSLAAETPYIQLQAIHPTNLTWTPQDKEVVILNSLTVVSRLLVQQLEEFLGAGGNLIVIPGPGTDDGLSLSTFQEQLGLPAMGPTPLVFDSPLSLDRETLGTSFLGEVFQREAELDELPQVSRLYRIYPRGTDEVVFRLTENMPMLTRASYNNGTVFLFSLPFHLQWTDLPLKGSFIPLWHHLIYWRATNPALIDVRVDDTPILTVSPRQATQSVTLIAPTNVTSLIIPDIRTRTVTLRDLNRPGNYILAFQGQNRSGAKQTPDEEIRFRVNIPDEELTGGTLNRSALLNLLGSDRTFILDESGSVGERIQQARFGRELWRPLLYLLIVLLILEMIFGNVYHSPRRPARESPRSERPESKRL